MRATVVQRIVDVYDEVPWPVILREREIRGLCELLRHGSNEVRGEFRIGFGMWPNANRDVRLARRSVRILIPRPLFGPKCIHDLNPSSQTRRPDYRLWRIWLAHNAEAQPPARLEPYEKIVDDCALVLLLNLAALAHRDS